MSEIPKGKTTIKEQQQKLEEFLAEQSEKLVIDDNNVPAEFIRQAQNYLASASKYNKAYMNMKIAKINRDSLEAQTRSELRSQAVADGVKVTEGLLSEQVGYNADVIKAQKVAAQAEYFSSQYQSTMRAWEHKRDMLIQLGSTLRAEFKAEQTYQPDTADQPVAMQSPPQQKQNVDAARERVKQKRQQEVKARNKVNLDSLDDLDDIQL